MNIKLCIKRFNQSWKESKWQSFDVECDENETVADLLRKLNKQKVLFDDKNEAVEKIDWECGCMQQKCGGCAMVINGKPQLACTAFIGELCRKTSILKVEPLSKFPVIKDLRVDRSKIYDDLRNMKIWISGQALYNPKEWEEQYLSASCIMCGCCLEVCPNYTFENSFTGAAIMNSAYRVATQQQAGSNRRLFIKENIRVGQGHCSKTLSCEAVCPMKIPTGSLMARMNKLFIKDLLGVKK